MVASDYYTLPVLLGLPLLASALPQPGTSISNSSSVSWSKCDSSEIPDTVDCGTLQVPLDHHNPQNGTITLGMMRLKAKGQSPLGSFFYNNGGPGQVSAPSIVKQAKWEAAGSDWEKGLPFVTEALREAYDIIGLDMRGQTLSSPLRCDKTFINKPVKQLAFDDESFQTLVEHNKAFAESCARMTGPLFFKMGTDQVIRDLDLVRQGVGDEKLNWMGWSGGSQIGAEYAELFPEHVGRMVLDGMNERSLSDTDSIIGEAVAYEASLNDFFRWCNTTTDCVMHGRDLPTIWDSLVDAAAKKPLAAPGCLNETRAPPCLPKVTDEDFLIYALDVLNVDAGFPLLAENLRKAWDEDDAIGFAPQRFESDVVNNNEIAFAHFDVLCSDYTRDHIRSAADLRAIFTAARALCPHTRGVNVMQHARTACLGWPFEPTNPQHTFNTEATSKLPTILIANSYWDPATSVQWAVTMREQLPSAVNVFRKGNHHTSYRRKGEVARVIDAFLVNGTVPADGTTYLT
ncbi:alpha/beta hydrolase fold-domain-containing protein [Hypoxylon trugodes]|uniref:alpha/beta hydrolase fold-domain-containing protein n=1 Tax=Hypoxylon trugodes TaxID=326681 RepID=UPI00219C623F|nr:alpha/beta hydrolase fold-domain-containing protein [Hypoxylon trugodes]KAI1394336.1 alpha/beta hydrolase fold-domain-containing protein [Hypoxylon trugodes]